MTYAKTLHALADPTRRALLEKLRKGPRPVGVLAAGLPVSRPAVSQHLRVLRDAGLVRERRVGTRRVYNVEVEGLDELRRYLDRLWEGVLGALRDETESGKGGRRGR
jgi:DNA-binding transcriptional ArsR family regulator